MKPCPKGARGAGMVRKLGLIASAIVLGGFVMVAGPDAGFRFGLGPRGAMAEQRRAQARIARLAAAPYDRPAGGFVLPWGEGPARPTDRILAPMGTSAIDPGFVVTGADVDPGIIAAPRVLGTNR